jgi:prepilin-type N-terminal cleavage/methylation domain-containing protein
MSRLPARLRDQRGFTLVELMVGVAIGSIVMLAIFALLDTSVKQSGKVSARVDSTQRGRTAMERITRELRSQVCFLAPGQSTPASIASAGPYSITYYAFNGSTTGQTGVLRAERRTITWNPNNNSIEQTIEQPSPATGPVTGWLPVKTRTIASSIMPPKAAAPATGSGPIFEYRPTTPINGTDPAFSGNPLTAADLRRVSRINVRFESIPTTAASKKPTTSFDSQVFVRSADPNGLVANQTDPSCV